MDEKPPRHIPAPSGVPHPVTPDRAPTTAEVRAMDGESVLLMPGQTSDNPAVSMRGSIRVDARGQVDVDLQFADMYDRPATTKRLRLNARQVAQLWASKTAYDGYALRLEGAIDVPATGERIVGRFGRGRPETDYTHHVTPRS